MATTITDELVLLIKAEATQALKELGSYKAAINDMGNAHKSVNEKVTASKKEVNENASAMSNARKAIKEVDLSTSNYGENLQTVNKAQQVTSAGARTMGAAIKSAIAPIALITGSVLFMKRILSDASEAYAKSEGESRKFSITYKDVADEANVAAKSWAETFDYAESTAKEVLGSAGDIFTGMGMAGDSALDLAGQTAYLGGALSKLNPQLGSAEEATQALITATTGEREALKRWGVIIQESAVQTKLLERGQADLTGTALLAAKAQATLDIAYEQSPNALAAVSSSTKLAADANRDLSEAWKENLELTGEVANKFFQPVKQLLADYIKDINSARKAQKEFMEINPNLELIQSYEDTANKVDDLIGSYEELKKKSVLTVEEQSDLKNIMIDIGNLVPSAVTQWNNYGEAIELSTTKAKEFADQQRELRIAEAEYQLLKLEYQEKTAKAEYEANKKSLEDTQNILNKKDEEIGKKRKAYSIAKELQLLMKDQDTGYESAIQFIKENASLLEDTVFSLEKVQNSSMPRDYINDQIDGTIERYGRLQEEIEKLNIEKAKYAVGTKEYEVLTSQIEQARAEVNMLTGDYESLIKQLEAQIAVIDPSRASWGELNKEFEAGALSAEEYVAALQKIVDASKKLDEPLAPDTSEWEAFVKTLTNGIGLEDALSLEVELSPIQSNDQMSKLEAQLDYYKELIEGLWSKKSDFESIDEWQTSLDEVVDKYDGIADQIEELTEDEKNSALATELKKSLLSDEEAARASLVELEAQLNTLLADNLVTQEEANKLLERGSELVKDASGLTERENRANELKRSLLSDEELKKIDLLELEKELLALEDEKLITEEERIKLIDQAKNSKDGDVKKSLDEIKDAKEYITASWDAIKESHFSQKEIASTLESVFSDMGAAVGSGEDAFAAAGKHLQKFASSLLSEISTMAIGAGLRLIVEGGIAALPGALALFALGGIAGFAGGFLGSGGSGVDSSIQDALSDELEIRESLNEALQESLDIEKDLLKRQLDRNLIGVDEYVAGMQDLNQQQNQSDAQTQLITLAQDEISNIDEELSGMSGWEKFWSGEDEDLEERAEAIAEIVKQINAAGTADELRQLIAQLENLGIDTSDLPKFAKGGSFITNGPQAILVGDNSSGRELVEVTPLGSANRREGQVIINIQGDVYGIEDLYGKLKLAEKKLNRRRIS